MKRTAPALLLAILTTMAPGTCLGASPGAFVEKGSPSERIPFDSFTDRLRAAGILDKTLPGRELSLADRVKIIRTAYDVLEDYAASEVSDLSFDLNYFEHLAPQDFYKKTYTDVITMPGGLMIDVMRSHVTQTNTGAYTVEYVPKWTDQEAQVLRAPDGRSLEIVSLSELFAIIDAQGFAEFATVNIVTTYQVTVTLRELSRVYQAAFIWYPHRATGKINFVVMDLITQGVAEAATEIHPPIYEPGTQKRRASLKTKKLCRAASSRTTNQPVEHKGYQDHLNPSDSSKHYAKAIFDITCSCESNCRSTCEASVIPLYCADKGFIHDGLCHKMSHGQGAKNNIEDDGTADGASCSAGFKCGAKSCVTGCACSGVSVSVNTGAGDVSFSLGPEAIWTGGFSYGRHCFSCQEIPQEEEKEEVYSGPILIDLGGHGLQLTGASDGVEFDLDADGIAETTVWTEVHSADAFLACDRNNNGVIDDGKELFGEMTPQSGTPEPNGFNALADYDKASYGGNEDGLISAEDAMFQLLLVWTDVNHNGVSEFAELAPLGSVVDAIELDYVETGRVDRFGNQYRYLSKAQLSGKGQGNAKTNVFDVWLVRED